MMSSSQPPSQTPKQVAHYQIQRLVGQGAFSKVYQAVDIGQPQRPTRALLELILEGDAEEAQIRRRAFQRMGQTLHRLNPRQHPAIPQIYETLAVGDRCFLVQDFVAGESYAHYLSADQNTDQSADHQRPLAAADVERMFTEVLDGLAELHKASIVHRDIKPANLIRRPDGSTAIIDFGSVCDLAVCDLSVGDLAGSSAGRSRRSESATVLGSATDAGHTRIYTPGYAHPDQRDGLDAASPRWDLYALAKTAIALRLGAHPPWSQAWSIDQLGFSQRVQALLREMLKLDDYVLADANDALKADLSSLKPAHAVQARSRRSGRNQPGWDERAAPRRLRNRWVLAGSLGLAAGLAALATAGGWRVYQTYQGYRNVAQGVEQGLAQGLAQANSAVAVLNTPSQGSGQCADYVQNAIPLPVPNRGFAARFQYPKAIAQGDASLQVWHEGDLIAEARDSDIQGFIWIKAMAQDIDFPPGEYRLLLQVSESVPYEEEVVLSEGFPFHYLGRVSALKLACAKSS